MRQSGGKAPVLLGYSSACLAATEGLGMVAERLGLGEAVDLYIACRRGEVTPEHVGNIARILRLDRVRHSSLVERLGARMPLDCVKPAHLLRFQGGLAPELSPLTRRAVIHCVRGFFRWCAAEDFIDRSPAENLRPRMVPLPPIRYLSSEQREDLMGFFARHLDEPWGLYGLLVAETGARAGEIRRLCWRYVGPDRVLLEYTKTRRPRIVPLPAGLARLLEARRCEPEDPLFGNGAGPVPKHIADHWIRIARRLEDAPRYRWNWKILRASYATHLLARGVPIEVISRLLGHARVDLTLSHYGHLRTSLWFASVLHALERDNSEGDARRQGKNLGG